MSELKVTLIDVGWGDSILVESTPSHGDKRYALIDSNDEENERTSFTFLKRFFDREPGNVVSRPRLFDFVILSHSHSDHGKGLKRIMSRYGTRRFWYPKSTSLGSQADLVRYANRSSKVEHHEAINRGKNLPDLGDAELSVLWPPYNVIDHHNENNNSIVLTIAVGNVSFMLTGDAEGPVWDRIADRIPPDTAFFKVPHHGSSDATFHQGDTPWIDHCPAGAHLAISCHVKPHNHPHGSVIQEFADQGYPYYRTDRHYHVTCVTDGTDVRVLYYH